MSLVGVKSLVFVRSYKDFLKKYKSTIIGRFNKQMCVGHVLKSAVENPLVHEYTCT